MPDVNELGEVAHGVGGAGAYYQNHLFSPGGGARWKNSDEIVFANANDNWFVSVYNVRTKKISRLDFGTNEFSPANTIFTGGDHVAIWYGVMGGTRSTTGFSLQGSGLLGMGPDGAIAYKPDYQSDGPTRVRELGGRDWLLTLGHAYSLQMLGNGKAVWWDTSTRRVEVCGGLPRPVLPPDASAVHMVEMPSGIWVSCFSESAGVIVTPADSLTGFRIVPPNTNAWHTVSRVDNLIQVTWATGEGEMEGEVRVRQIDIEQNLIRDPWGDNTWKPIVREDFSLPNISDVPPINRELWLGFFEFAGDNPASPGNCTLLVRNASGNTIRPTIVTDETIDRVTANARGPIIGHWVSGSSVPEISALAARTTYPPVAYWDDRIWPAVPAMPANGIIAIQAYCRKDESLNQFETSLQREIDRLPGKLALVCQCYTSNTLMTTNLSALVPVFARLAKQNPRIVMLLVFSGFGRQTGLQDHPDVRAFWERIANSIQLPPVEKPMAPPKITITEYGPKSGTVPLRVRAVYAPEPGAGPIDRLQWLIRKNDTGTWQLAALNPSDDPDHTYVIKEPGTWEIKLRASGPGGDWETMAKRIVQAAPSVPVPDPEEPPEEPSKPEPKPMEGEWTNFQTAKEFFICADRGLPKAQLVADRKSAGEYEKFFALKDDTRIKLRATNGKYVRVVNALPYADADESKGEWFEVSQLGDGKIGLTATSTKKVMCAEAGGGGIVTVSRTEIKMWESFLSSLAKGNSRAKRHGLVRSEGRKIVDDDGTYFPLGASFFWAPWGWKHDRERTEQNMEFLSRYVDYFRMFGEVGGPSWEDRAIDPREGDYESTLADLMDTAYDKYGLRIELTVFAGGSGAPYDLVTDKIRNVVQSRTHMIQNFEGSNEGDARVGDSHDELRRQTQRIRSWFPGLVTTSSFGEMDKDITNFHTDHFDRGWGDGDWRFVRQPWDAKGYPYAGSQNEPIGPHASVRETRNALRLCMLRAVGIMCGMSGFVLHTGAGVRGGGSGDGPAGSHPFQRHANFWDYQADFDSIIPALRAVESLIPADVPNWRKTRHGWADHPLRTDDIWPDGKVDYGVVRNHCAYSGGEFVTMPIGVKDHADLQARDTCHVKIYEPMTGKLVREESVSSGQMLHLSGANRETDPDAGVAYIVVGTR